MNKKIKDAYDKWFKVVMFKSSMGYDEPEWDEFVSCCKAEPFDDVISFFIELLETPNHAVHALDLLFPNVLTYEGRYVTLKDLCDAWKLSLIWMRDDASKVMEINQ